MSLTFVHPEHIQHLSTAQCLAVTESQLHLSPTISSEEGAGCDGAGVLLLSDHAVALDVDDDILDVGVPRPAVLLQDAHLAGPGSDTWTVELETTVIRRFPNISQSQRRPL